MAELMREEVAPLLKGIERYNRDNLQKLERYVVIQAQENAYDLDANLAVLKLYQFLPSEFKAEITCLILLKSLTNLPHTDFVLCKCLLTETQCNDEPIASIIYLHDILERCDFQVFWNRVYNLPEVCSNIKGFNDSIRKFICYVVGITYQTIEKGQLAQFLGGIDDKTLAYWIKAYGWNDQGSTIFVTNQDENIKNKNITEKIDFDAVATVMANCI